MPLINRTYFDGELLLVVNEDSAGLAVDAAVATYEPEFLRKALGQSLYDAFMAGLVAAEGGFSNRFSDAFLQGEIAERWAWLRDGKTFTYGGRSYTWPGLTSVTRSPVAAYVYWMHRRNNATQTVSNTAEASTKSENADRAPVDAKMVAAWNRMRQDNVLLATMCDSLTVDGAKVYPEFDLQEPDSDVYEHQNTFGI